MVGKADEYFHGGVTDLDCSVGQSRHADEEQKENEAGDEAQSLHHHHHHHDDGHEDEDEESGEKEAGAAQCAPWSFVTRAIRLPSIERHLEGESSREILPWLWAACRVDSGNINAYANAAYVLESLYGDAEKALAVLDEGIRANPRSSELEFQKGMLLLHRVKAPERAETSFRAALAKVPKDDALKNRDDTDATLMAVRILALLGKLADDRGEKAEVQRCYKMALGIAPNHSMTIRLRALAGESAELH
jgi:tetratricopeptide (TPR) repeat protein